MGREGQERSDQAFMIATYDSTQSHCFECRTVMPRFSNIDRDGKAFYVSCRGEANHAMVQWKF